MITCHCRPFRHYTAPGTAHNNIPPLQAPQTPTEPTSPPSNSPVRVASRYPRIAGPVLTPGVLSSSLPPNARKTRHAAPKTTVVHHTTTTPPTIPAKQHCCLQLSTRKVTFPLRKPYEPRHQTATARLLILGNTGLYPLKGFSLKKRHQRTRPLHKGRPTRPLCQQPPKYERPTLYLQPGIGFATELVRMALEDGQTGIVSTVQHNRSGM